MSHRNTAISLLALLCVTIFPGQLVAQQVVTVPSTRKVLQDSPLPDSTEITLHAAQNEWEAFQIVITHDEAISEIDVELSDLCSSGDEHCIPASQAILYLEHFLEVTTPSPLPVTLHEREAWLYPDPLIPFLDPYADGEVPAGAPFDLEADERGVVFVDLHVPIDTPAGEYSGTALVTSGAGDLGEISIELTVWDFEMPQERTIATAFSFNEDKVRLFHGGPDGDPPEGFDEIVRNYFQAIHSHRIDPTHINARVSFNFDGEGNLEPVDWTEYDAKLGPFMDGSMFDDGLGVTRFNLRYFRPGSGLGSMTEEQYEQAALAFADHLEERGWWDRGYIYAIDEPWLNNPESKYTRIINDSERLLNITDRWEGKILVTSPYVAELEGLVGIWTPVTPMYENWFYAEGYPPYIVPTMPGREIYTERIEAGDELWFYVCNANTPPYAGFDIDTTIGYEPRIVMWGTWYENATGFLYWRMTYWIDDDPWNVLLNLEAFDEFTARNGDGILIYPGDHNGTALGKGSPTDVSIDGPIVSYRLKQIRDGFEDWEMFRIAADLGAEEYARAQVDRAYTRFGNFFMEFCGGSWEGFYCPDDQPWTLDENVLLEARQNIGAKIQYLLHPDLYPDPEEDLPEPQPETEPETGPDADPDTDPDAGPDTDPDDDPEPDTGPDSDAPDFEASGGCDGCRIGYQSNINGFLRIIGF